MHFLYYRCILPSSSVIKCESVHFHSRVNRWNRLMKKGLRAHATLVVHPSIFLLVCHTQLKSREHQQRPVLFLHSYQHTVCLEGIHFSLQPRDFMIAEAHGMAMSSKRCICSNCNTSAIVTVGTGACGKTVLCSSLWKDRAL